MLKEVRMKPDITQELGQIAAPQKKKPSGLWQAVKRLMMVLDVGDNDVKDKGSLFSVLGRRPEADEDEVIHSPNHGFFAFSAILCFSVIIWMNIGTLDIVSMTQGEVIPSTQLKTIQHLEGGIVLEISVEEGEVVKKGQPLVVLDKTLSNADVGELVVRLDALTIDLVRLGAEAKSDSDLVFSDELKSKAPHNVKQATNLFNARKNAQKSKVSSQNHLITRRINEIDEISARLEKERAAVFLHKEQIAISEQLLLDGLSNRYEHLELLQKANELSGGIKEDEAALRTARAALDGAKAELSNISDSYLEQVMTDLDETQLEYNELFERLKKFEDNLRRTVLRAPVDGIVKTIYVATVGGIIKAGDNVVDIVPGEDRLVIEAKLPTQDIGYIEIGQDVDVKLASADAARFGGLQGLVTQISPDTLVSDDGVPYYKVRVETDKSYFESGAQRYHLFPGMQVMANIKTGDRTIFQYLFDPMLRGMDDALQER
jgi:membrane fusion protein, adhesin transport system